MKNLAVEGLKTPWVGLGEKNSLNGALMWSMDAMMWMLVDEAKQLNTDCTWKVKMIQFNEGTHLTQLTQSKLFNLVETNSTFFTSHNKHISILN